MSWTTPQDITDRWIGSGAPTDDDLVAALIRDAETVVLGAYPRIQERIDGGTLSLDVVVMVVARMVTRVLRNPENLSYWQQSTGPFSQGRNFGKQVDIWLTSDEKTLLAPSSRGKAFSFNIAPDMQRPAPNILDIEDEDLVWKDLD